MGYVVAPIIIFDPRMPQGDDHLHWWRFFFCFWQLNHQPLVGSATNGCAQMVKTGGVKDLPPES